MCVDLFTDGAGLELPTGAQAGPTAVQITELPASLLQRTVKAARANGTTAHALFLMALAKARRDYIEGAGATRTLRINDFATLRPLADADLSEAFDVLVVPNQLHIDPNWDERTALHILTETIRAEEGRCVVRGISTVGLRYACTPAGRSPRFVFKLVNKSDLAVTNQQSTLARRSCTIW